MTFKLHKPDRFLDLRYHQIECSPSVCGLCVGYEQNKWRSTQLIEYIVQWLPEFALTLEECRSFNYANSVGLVKKAACLIYKTEKFQSRGEFGELFLHAIIRDVHDSIPAISKIYYKSALNETVKGFDAVHVVNSDEGLELWLGEAKFYSDANDAIREVAKEIEGHFETDYLRTEFILIGNKLNEDIPMYDELKRLLNKNTSLDAVFRRACVPVFLTYNSGCVSSCSKIDDVYEVAFSKEIERISTQFKEAMSHRLLPSEIRIHLFLLPLKCKADLVEEMDRKLRAWQNI